MVLVLKCLRRRGHGLKSHRTDREKPGIKPATPGLQDIGLSPTPRQLLKDKYRNRKHFFMIFFGASGYITVILLIVIWNFLKKLYESNYCHSLSFSYIW